MTIEEARDIHETTTEIVSAASPDWAMRSEYVEIQTEAELEKLRKKIERQKEVQGYRECGQCRDCTYCLITRELRVGQVVNTSYSCTRGRFNVKPNGTCHSSHVGKRGPMILVRMLEGNEPMIREDNFIPPDPAKCFEMEKRQILMIQEQRKQKIIEKRKAMEAEVAKELEKEMGRVKESVGKSEEEGGL